MATRRVVGLLSQRNCPARKTGQHRFMREKAGTKRGPPQPVGLAKPLQTDKCMYCGKTRAELEDTI